LGPGDQVGFHHPHRPLLPAPCRTSILYRRRPACELGGRRAASSPASRRLHHRRLGRSDRWHQGLLLVAAARVRWVRPVRFGATRAVLRRLKRLRRLMMESSATVARLAPAVIDPRRWWALALLCGAFFMVLLD